MYEIQTPMYQCFYILHIFFNLHLGKQILREIK